MPSYPALAITYATDEDIAIRCTSDFDKLAPADQAQASGVDGAINAAGWNLTAASVESWGAMGVAEGMVVQLKLPKPGASPVQYLPMQLLVVDQVDVPSGTLVLRRKGLASGVGMPPGQAGGTAGASYLIATLKPQIDNACFDLNHRFGVDPAVPGRTPQQFYDVREVNAVTALTVLRDQYADMARSAGKDAADTFWVKSRRAGAQLDECLDRLIVHWMNTTGFGVAPIEPTTTRFTTRISR